jgi:protein SCO1
LNQLSVKTGAVEWFFILNSRVNKKALYAVMLAMLLPLVSYFIVKRKSETAVTMPRHYLPDSIITTTKNGKRGTDTAWHQLADLYHGIA